MLKHVLKISCLDQPGIVAAVAGCIKESGGNITSSAQFEDPDSRQFFMRVEFTADDVSLFNDTFALTAEKFSISWHIRSVDKKPKILIMVSKAGHCLADLLYRWSIGDLPVDIVGIVGNHPRKALEVRDLSDLPYTHLPITKDNKVEQEKKLKDMIEKQNVDTVVLARYMQILSNDFCASMNGRIINIHHSFLPGFKGAKPYHQAYARGVKMIGATAHFVTADLDEGPIIEQDVERITHADVPEDMVRKGRDVERRVLTRAVTLNAEDRVFLAGSKTVIL